MFKYDLKVKKINFKNKSKYMGYIFLLNELNYLYVHTVRKLTVL